MYEAKNDLLGQALYTNLLAVCPRKLKAFKTLSNLLVNWVLFRAQTI